MVTAKTQRLFCFHLEVLLNIGDGADHKDEGPSGFKDGGSFEFAVGANSLVKLKKHFCLLSGRQIFSRDTDTLVL